MNTGSRRTGGGGQDGGWHDLSQSMEVRHPSEPGCRHNPGKSRQASELPRGRQARQCGDGETGRGGWAHTAGERSKTTSSNTLPAPLAAAVKMGKLSFIKGPRF